MSQIIQKNVRKADMTAQNQYDWSRLVFSRKEFLESTYEESKEEILFSYETEGTQNFKEIKSEKREEILIALMDCAKLSEVCKHYKVQLYPENLYYDIHRHVKVMFRDVYGSGEKMCIRDRCRGVKRGKPCDHGVHSDHFRRFRGSVCPCR